MALPVYGHGISRSIALAVETSFGVQGAGPGQLLRRTQFSMDRQVQAIESSEITTDAQLLDARHGPILIPGTLAGQLSPGTYKSVFEGLLRGTWTAGVSLGSISDSAITIDGTTGVITLNSAGSNFLSAGFKKGDVARFSGLTGGPAVGNAVNLRTTNVTAHTMVFGPQSSVVAYASGQSALTVAVVGKKLTIPAAASQVQRSYSLEDWRADIQQSRLGTGIRFTQIGLNIPASGFVTLNASFTGQNRSDTGSQVYGSPTSQSTSSGVTGTNGKVTYQGTDLAYVTAANIGVSAATQPAQVVGNQLAPEIFVGMLSARGTASLLVTPDTIGADFLNEAEVDMEYFLTSSPAANADFVSVYLPRLKLMTDTTQDSDRALTRSVGFTSLQQINGGAGTAWDNSTIVIQDSLA